MKPFIVIPALVFSALIVTATLAAEHPMQMEGKECLTCHADKDVVGDKVKVVNEYNESIHSYSGVACGMCHGDEKNFRLAPVKADCVPCHSAQVSKVKSKERCESCHIAHAYNVHGGRK